MQNLTRTASFYLLAFALLVLGFVNPGRAENRIARGFELDRVMYAVSSRFRLMIRAGRRSNFLTRSSKSLIRWVFVGPLGTASSVAS